MNYNLLGIAFCALMFLFGLNLITLLKGLKTMDAINTSIQNLNTALQTVTEKFGQLKSGQIDPATLADAAAKIQAAADALTSLAQ